MPRGETPEPQNGSWSPPHCRGGPTPSHLPQLPSMHVWPGGQGAVPHAPENEPIQVNGAVVVGQEFFFLMIRRPPRSTLSPTRLSSDLSPGLSPTTGSFYRHSQAVEHAGGS